MFLHIIEISFRFKDLLNNVVFIDRKLFEDVVNTWNV